MKLSEGRDVLKEIEPQKPVHRALGRRVVTSHRKRSHLLFQTHNERQSNDGEVFQTTGSDDREFPPRFRRVATDGEGYFRRNHRSRCPGIDSQANEFTSLGTFQECVRDQDSRRQNGGRLGHRLKSDQCNRIACRQTIIRVSHQSQSFMAHHCLIDVIPISAVSQKPSTPRERDRRIHLNNGYEEPFAAESLPDLINWLAFHRNEILSGKEPLSNG